MVATTSRLDSLPSSLRGAFHHLVRARPLDERRDDLPFLALAEIRDILATETLFRTRYPSPPPPSLALLELVAQLPLEGGLPTLRGVIVRSMALSTGPELIAPPDLPLPADPLASQPVPPTASSTEPALPAPPPKDIPPSVLTGLPQLTKSERIVLQHLARNKTSREIAKTLFVSVRTVQNHRARICDKLGLRGNNALLGVALELREHLGPPP
ncbi:MAG TPA: helix-turn-helix transcriptional regulator [Myxococcota bacterium]|nr:helix-turn-helix transcriptional regulator [Myxococcota bacterium]